MVKLIIEGGGSHGLDSELRKAFNILLKKSGISPLPRIIAGHDRTKAYDRFKTLLQKHEKAILLIDSEKAISANYQDRPWDFLKSFEQWDWVSGLKDEDCHLMVQCMEAWFFADKKCLTDYYGANFNVNSLPGSPIEGISKDQFQSILSHAASQCKSKNKYDKGRDSFKILLLVDPDKVRAKSYWAERFFSTISQTMKTEIS